MSAIDMPCSHVGKAVADGTPISRDGWPGSITYVDADSIRWRVLSAGSGDAVVFIHGTGSSLESWRDMLPRLAVQRQAIAIDLPGHGHTQPLPRDRVSMPAMATGIARCLAKLGVVPKALIGHSAGVAIALRMAIDGDVNPEKIIGFNPALFPFGGRRNQLFAPIARMCASIPLLPRVIARRASDARSIERMIGGTGSRLSREGLAVYQRLFQNEQHVQATIAMMANWNLAGLVAAIGPWADRTHFIVGERDTAVEPSEAFELQRRYPELHVTCMAQAGHLAHEEKPLESAAIVDSILSDRSRT
jgi:magnesium chelatase accessory protein